MSSFFWPVGIAYVGHTFKSILWDSVRSFHIALIIPEEVSAGGQENSGRQPTFAALRSLLNSACHGTATGPRIIGLYFAANAGLVTFLLWRAMYGVWARWVRSRRCSIAALEASGSDVALGERNHGGGQKHKDSGPGMPAGLLSDT